MIALAVGKKAISGSDGVRQGVEITKSFFGDDLGLKSKLEIGEKNHVD